MSSDKNKVPYSLPGALGIWQQLGLSYDDISVDTGHVMIESALARSHVSTVPLQRYRYPI